MATRFSMAVARRYGLKSLSFQVSIRTRLRSHRRASSISKPFAIRCANWTRREKEAAIRSNGAVRANFFANFFHFSASCGLANELDCVGNFKTSNFRASGDARRPSVEGAAGLLAFQKAMRCGRE